MYKQGFAINKNYIVGMEESAHSQSLKRTALQVQMHQNSRFFACFKNIPTLSSKNYFMNSRTEVEVFSWDTNIGKRKPCNT